MANNDAANVRPAWLTKLAKILDRPGLPASWDVIAVTETDGRSETGVTVGLIDSLIVVARVLRQRDLTNPDVREALADLAGDEDLAFLLSVVRNE